jgi:uncharacterized protein (DUF849 family)
VLIQAALNGGRTRTEHPGIPVAPEELAAAAKECAAAGAGAIHFHARRSDGYESVDRDDVGRAVTAVRGAAPGTPVGVSTGAWILQNSALRHEAVARWTVLPDFASVNMKEDGAVELAELLLSRGVGIEAGLSNERGSEIFVASGLGAKCLRVLLEPMEQETRTALRTVDEIEAVLAAGRLLPPLLLHGLNATAWELIDEAAKRGYDTRVGFEDILTLPDGQKAVSNAALIAEARKRTSKR